MSCPNDGARSSDGASLEKLRKEYEVTYLPVLRNQLWMKRWVRLLLLASTDCVCTSDKGMEWATVTIPQILLEWRDFAPTNVFYELPGGSVEFDLLDDETVLQRQEAENEVNQNVLDLLDQAPRLVGEYWAKPSIVDVDWLNSELKQMRLQRESRKSVYADTEDSVMLSLHSRDRSAQSDDDLL